VLVFGHARKKTFFFRIRLVDHIYLYRRIFMKSVKRGLGLLLVVAMLVGALAGCTKNTDPGTQQPATNNTGSTNTDSKQGSSSDSNSSTGDQGTDTTPVDAVPVYETLDKDVAGDISIMVWSGDSVYYEDLGHKDIAVEDLTSQNVAAVYAMAKAFNNKYPNVKINLWAKTDDPNANDTSWYQEMENFKAEHGKYPDVYASTDLVGDVSKGLVADLSVFADDPVYQSFNKSIMDIMNYYGFQAGLPQFMQPWAIWVNKDLAEQNNIDVPEPTWNIDEYTEFITSADGQTFWGEVELPIKNIDTGCDTLIKSMANYSGTGDRVDLTSEQVDKLLSYIPTWSKYTIWQQYGLGNVPQEVMDDGWWWGYRFFCRNYVLTSQGDPWMMGAAAAPGAEVNVVESSDWDIYPRPSTDYVGNNVGIVIDPMAIHNYAMDDGNPEWSDAEMAQFKLAYTFGSFWCGSTESFQARADQMFNDNGTLKSCLNDSFPLVTGAEFDKQMDIWYSVGIHERYGDAKLMPGFQYVLKLWQEGQLWDVSDKCYPYFVTEDGAQKACLYEWLNCYSADVAGVDVTEANWLDNVKARLADWNEVINARFVQADEGLRSGLTKYYGFTDADFK
jgi:maltose-binding protein MalE